LTDTTAGTEDDNLGELDGREEYNGQSMLCPNGAIAAISAERGRGG
jgi:hypothetical protein